jgi:hypothetical protein
VSGARIQLGRETRGPGVVAASDGAVIDLDLQASEPTAALGCRNWPRVSGLCNNSVEGSSKGRGHMQTGRLA